MNSQEILEKAIKKAKVGGWEKLDDGILYSSIKQEVWLPHPNPITISTRDLLFDHSFAKALWGEDLIRLARGNNVGQTITYHAPAWQVRLEDMVMSDNLIQYLKENI